MTAIFKSKEERKGKKSAEGSAFKPQRRESGVKRIFYILFAAVSFAAIAEYLFVCGTFTGPLVMFLALAIGLANIIVSVKNKDWRAALLFLIATIALCMGYWKIMF